MSNNTQPSLPLPTDSVRLLAERYLPTPGISQTVPLEALLKTTGTVVEGRPSTHTSRRELAARLRTLATIISNTTEIDLGVTAGPVTGTDCWSHQYHAVALSTAGVLADMLAAYPDIEAQAACEAVRATFRDSPTDRVTAVSRVLRAQAAVYDLAGLVRLGATLTRVVDASQSTHLDAQQHLIDDIETAISNGNRAELLSLAHRLDTARHGVWTTAHLEQFDHRTFEYLLARLWADTADAVLVTRQVRDHGIDIIAALGDRTVLVEAKLHARSNPVGIATVQRTAGVRQEVDADAAIVATSGRFSRDAHQSAANLERVALLNGDRLTTLLTESPLLPPLSPSGS